MKTFPGDRASLGCVRVSQPVGEIHVSGEWSHSERATHAHVHGYADGPRYEAHDADGNAHAHGNAHGSCAAWSSRSVRLVAGRGKDAARHLPECVAHFDDALLGSRCGATGS